MFSLSGAEAKIKAAQADSAKKLKQMQQAAQSAAHPLAQKSKAQSKAPPLPGGKPPKGIAKGKGYTFTMGKLSLLAISLSLMVLGAFTFFSGFLVGAWYYEKTQPAQVNYAMSQSQPSGGMVGGMVNNDISSLRGGIADEAKKIGLGSMAGGATAYQVRGALQSTDIPGVPSFLQPFVDQVKDVLGAEAGSAAGKVVRGEVGKAISSSQPSTGSSDGKESSGGAGGAASSSSPSASSSTSAPSPSTSPSSSSDSSSAGGPGSSAAAAKSADSGSKAKGEYTIQLGAYVAKENADAMTKTLKMKNYDAYVEEGKESSGQSIYYVRVGHYDTYDFAHTVALRFIDNNIPGATIVKVSNDKK